MRPLGNVRVVDVTVSLAGPYCTQLLGALGADVIKVERPGAGDETRAWGLDGESPLFLSANANKRSLALDLSTDEGRDSVVRLADEADVFVQSLRPGLAERLGLGAAELRARNQRLVYCSIGAFGGEGPLRQEAGYDPLMQAAAGIMSVTGEKDGPPVRVGVSLVDQATALWGALGILLALGERQRTGEGTTVEVSLYEAAVSLMAYHVIDYLRTGSIPGRHGTAFPLIAPYESFEAKDGPLMVPPLASRPARSTTSRTSPAASRRERSAYYRASAIYSSSRRRSRSTENGSCTRLHRPNSAPLPTSSSASCEMARDVPHDAAVQPQDRAASAPVYRLTVAGPAR